MSLHLSFLCPSIGAKLMRHRMVQRKSMLHGAVTCREMRGRGCGRLANTIINAQHSTAQQVVEQVQWVAVA